MPNKHFCQGPWCQLRLLWPYDCLCERFLRWMRLPKRRKSCLWTSLLQGHHGRASS